MRGFVLGFHVCRLPCSGQYCLYVAKGAERCGYIVDPLHDRESRRGSAAEAAIVEDLIMRTSLKQKIIAVCDTKINQKGANVGLSFYAFFHNRNDDPELLMQAATWWIQTHKLDHFEKATKIKRMVELELS